MTEIYKPFIVMHVT